ncbi:MAG: DUF1588 domain-containing protein [Pirellulaceae bacterium]
MFEPQLAVRRFLNCRWSAKSTKTQHERGPWLLTCSNDAGGVVATVNVFRTAETSLTQGPSSVEWRLLKKPADLTTLNCQMICRRVSKPTLILLAFLASNAMAGDLPDELVLPQDLRALVVNYCTDCHGKDVSEGDVSFADLENLKLDARLALLNKAHEQLHFHRMPPEDQQQPSAAEHARLVDWLSAELNRYSSNELEDKLRRPEYGNYVDHDKLFSGEYADLKPFTYDRRWLISEYIFDAKFNRILDHNPTLDIDGKRHYVIGSNSRRVNLTNPFLLPTNSGVRYYANETLSGGHLLTMLTNAKEAATHMMYLAGRDSRYLPAVNEIMALEDQHNATLASRENFLNIHIERVLEDIYQDKHEALLPKFVRVDVPEPIPTDGTVKKAPYHAANPGQAEVILIFHSMRRHRLDDQTDVELIENCEREWFNHGHNERKIQARITFLNNYMEELRKQIKEHRYQEKYKPIDFQPLAEAEMQAITQAVLQHRQQGDHFDTIIERCMAQWELEFEQARIAAGPPSQQLVAGLVEQLFGKILERSPTAEEAAEYAALTNSYMDSLGDRKAIEKLVQTLILNTEFVYRNEFGRSEADEHGRKMMSPRDASYAISYALTDSSPDEELVEAAAAGRLKTREDYEREVRRMLARRDQYYVIDESVHSFRDIANFTNMPIRELRFFRDFFGYPKLLPIFKDNKRFGANYDAAKQRLVTETDRLVEHIVEQDQDVFRQLLTTDKFYVFHSGDNEAMQASSNRIRRIYDYFKDKDWESFEIDDLARHKDFIAEVKMRGIDVNRLQPGGRYNPLRSFKTQVESFTLRLDKGQTAAAPYNSFPAHGMANASSRYGGRLQSPEVARFFNIDLANWNYPAIQPAGMEHRKGMLTHPAWLIAHAQNTETDPIHRGKWIQEKLLAGTIPDVPITVEAVIPEDPHQTLRQRLEAKTNNNYCWQCHQKMNPLGLPFEMYDDFGRFRTEERLEYPENLIQKVKDKGAPHEDLRDVYKTLPVNPRGYLAGTGDDNLDGEVSDALELIDRLARSDRVRQSIIRHAFRYFMGRNERLSDSKTLIDADRAYIHSGGSFDAVIVSLLTSDSFIYRKPIEN